MISVCRRTEATWKKATDSKSAISKCRSYSLGIRSRMTLHGVSHQKKACQNNSFGLCLRQENETGRENG